MKYEELLFLWLLSLLVRGLHVDSSFVALLGHISLGLRCSIYYFWAKELMMVQALLMLVSVHLDYGFVLLIQVDIQLKSHSFYILDYGAKQQVFIAYFNEKVHYILAHKSFSHKRCYM
jgi:hypothetical protein